MTNREIAEGMGIRLDIIESVEASDPAYWKYLRRTVLQKRRGRSRKMESGMASARCPQCEILAGEILRLVERFSSLLHGYA